MRAVGRRQGAVQKQNLVTCSLCKAKQTELIWCLCILCEGKHDSWIFDRLTRRFLHLKSCNSHTGQKNYQSSGDFFFFYILITIITLLRSNPVLSFAVIQPQWSLHLFSFSNSLSQRPTFATVSLIGAALLLIYWAKKEQLSVAYVTFDTNSRSLNNYHNIFGGVGGALTIQSFWLDKDLFCVDAQNVSRCRTINKKKPLRTYELACLWSAPCSTSLPPPVIIFFSFFYYLWPGLMT